MGPGYSIPIYSASRIRLGSPMESTVIFTKVFMMEMSSMALWVEPPPEVRPPPVPMMRTGRFW